MAGLSGRPGRLVLDAGGVSAIATGSGIARAALERARREGWIVVIPAPVLVEIHTGRPDHARIDRVVNAVDIVIDTTQERAKQAGELRSRSGVRDVVDAIAVAEAVAAPPAVIMTSDPDDIRILIDTAGASDRVGIIVV